MPGRPGVDVNFILAKRETATMVLQGERNTVLYESGAFGLRYDTMQNARRDTNEVVERKKIRTVLASLAVGENEKSRAPRKRISLY